MYCLLSSSPPDVARSFIFIWYKLYLKYSYVASDLLMTSEKKSSMYWNRSLTKIWTRVYDLSRFQ